jgi:hypothetical protein
MRLVPTKAGQLFANIVSETSLKSKPVRSIGELGWVLAASELGRFDLLPESNISEENKDNTAIVSGCHEAADAEKACAAYFMSQLSTDTEREIFQLWQRARDKKETVPSVARVLTTCTSIAKGSMIGYLRLKSNGEILVEYANSRLKAAFGIKVCPIPYLDTLETGPAGLRASLFTACIVAQRPMSFSGALPHSAHIGLDYSRLILPAASPEMQAGRERWADSVIVIITNIPCSARVCRDRGESLHCLDRIAMG